MSSARAADERWLFLDVETTGGTATRDRVTEVAWVLLDGNTVTRESYLVNPHTNIAPFIQQLTGITNEMVADAPDFAAIAPKLQEAMQGAVFVAHNARFDYGFIKNEFKRAGLGFRAPVLCTVKLARLVDPQEKRHNLDAVAARYALQSATRHRALADADLLYQFWQALRARLGDECLMQHATQLLGQASWPSHLDSDALDNMPDTPGVYVFYGERRFVLYVGKSKHLRRRVLSHFSGDHARGKELSLSLQTTDIEWHCTAGEVGALLKESQLVKQLVPSHNVRLRRAKSLCSWRWLDDEPPTLVWTQDLNMGAQPNLFGLFSSQRQAQQWLGELAQEHKLCKALLGLEKVSAGAGCFGSQVGQCKGACKGHEAPALHSVRTLAAMTPKKLATWPFKGPVGLIESGLGPDGEAQTDVHVVDAWCYLGTAQSEQDCAELLQVAKPVFDADTYHILRKAVAKLPHRLLC
jgi:DNA polymerase III subunit epsilon